MATLKSVLNPQAEPFVEIIDNLCLGRLETRYFFLDLETFKDLAINDMSGASRIYWHEMLQRAHIAAVTAILRSRDWLSAVLSAAEDGNFLAFAAAYRGLMESAADASTSLGTVPLTLANAHPAIAEALSGRAQAIIVNSALEEELIHYSHARYLKRSERADTPESHSARSSQEYLQFISATKDESEEVQRCYRFLCDATHPAATTVWMWLAPDDPAGLQYKISANQGAGLIEGFLQEYPSMTLDLLMFAFNPPVMTLNMLNYFPVDSLHTPELLTWNLDGIPGWVKCRNELQRLRIAPCASLSQP